MQIAYDAALCRRGCHDVVQCVDHAPGRRRDQHIRRVQEQPRRGCAFASVRRAVVRILAEEDEAESETDPEWEVEKLLGYIAGQAAASRKESVTAVRLIEAQAQAGRVLTPEEVKAIAEGVALELSDDFEVTGDVKLAK